MELESYCACSPDPIWLPCQFSCSSDYKREPVIIPSPKAITNQTIFMDLDFFAGIDFAARSEIVLPSAGNPLECQRLCLQYDNCSCWTYQEAACYLKVSCFGVVENKFSPPQSFVGLRSTCELSNVTFTSNITNGRQMKASSASECDQLCNTWDGCRCWTFKNHSDCLLFNNCTLSKVQNGSISAFRNCELPMLYLDIYQSSDCSMAPGDSSIFFSISPVTCGLVPNVGIPFNYSYTYMNGIPTLGFDCNATCGNCRFQISQLQSIYDECTTDGTYSLIINENSDNSFYYPESTYDYIMQRTFMGENCTTLENGVAINLGELNVCHVSDSGISFFGVFTITINNTQLYEVRQDCLYSNCTNCIDVVQLPQTLDKCINYKLEQASLMIHLVEAHVVTTSNWWKIFLAVLAVIIFLNCI